MAVVLFAAAGISAQATRATPKPLATPPVVSSAEIISRASDLEAERRILPQDQGKPAETSTPESELIKQLNERIKKLEAAQKVDKDEKQKRLLLNLDILTRAEQRSEALRKQMFEMIEKENTVKARLEQIEIEMRPEYIERALMLNGSLRPEAVREARAKSLAAERSNLQALLNEIQSTRASLSVNLEKSESIVTKLRTKLEKDIDDALTDEPGTV